MPIKIDFYICWDASLYQIPSGAMVAHQTSNLGVAGSSPVLGKNNHNIMLKNSFVFLNLYVIDKNCIYLTTLWIALLISNKFFHIRTYARIHSLEMVCNMDWEGFNLNIVWFFYWGQNLRLYRFYSTTNA